MAIINTYNPLFLFIILSLFWSKTGAIASRLWVRWEQGEISILCHLPTLSAIVLSTEVNQLIWAWPLFFSSSLKWDVN